MHSLFVMDQVKLLRMFGDFDRKIHGILGVEYKNCSATWKLVKARLAEDRGCSVFITTKPVDQVKTHMVRSLDEFVVALGDK